MEVGAELRLMFCCSLLLISCGQLLLCCATKARLVAGRPPGLSTPTRPYVRHTPLEPILFFQLLSASSFSAPFHTWRWGGCHCDACPLARRCHGRAPCSRCPAPPRSGARAARSRSMGRASRWASTTARPPRRVTLAQPPAPTACMLACGQQQSAQEALTHASSVPLIPSWLLRLRYSPAPQGYPPCPGSGLLSVAVARHASTTPHPLLRCALTRPRGAPTTLGRW
jgi:hypothetical protein